MITPLFPSDKNPQGQIAPDWYKPFYFQVGESGAYRTDMNYGNVRDTKEFGLWMKHAPYAIFPKTKEAVVQTWKDEQGDDVFLPPGEALCASYEYTVEFTYIDNDGNATVNINNFRKTITNKWLIIGDDYTNTVRRAARVIEFDNDPKYVRRGDTVHVEFKVKFSINSPEVDATFVTV